MNSSFVSSFRYIIIISASIIPWVYMYIIIPRRKISLIHTKSMRSISARLTAGPSFAPGPCQTLIRHCCVYGWVFVASFNNQHAKYYLLGFFPNIIIQVQHCHIHGHFLNRISKTSCQLGMCLSSIITIIINNNNNSYHRKIEWAEGNKQKNEYVSKKITKHKILYMYIRVYYYYFLYAYA